MSYPPIPDEPLVIVVVPGPIVGTERFLHDTHEHQAIVLSSVIRDALRTVGHKDFTVKIEKREGRSPQ